MLWKIHQFIHFFATNHWNPDKKQCNRKNFLPYIWFFFLRKAKNTVFWAKTVFEGWLAPTLFLVLSLVSTVCGFGRKILHKMTDISSLRRSVTPISWSFNYFPQDLLLRFIFLRATTNESNPGIKYKSKIVNLSANPYEK